MRDFESFVKHLKVMKIEPPTVIDVGVAWGTPELYNNFSNSYFILIEALDYFRNDLERIVADVRGEYHLFAVGDRPGELQISIDLAPKSLAGANVLDGPKHGKHTFDVVVKTIDEILANKDLAAGNLLKLDVQGADLRALRGATNTLKKCDVVIVEASLANSKNLVRDIINFLFGQGFVLYDIFGALNRPFDNALGQVDLAFMRNGHDLVSYEGWS